MSAPGLCAVVCGTTFGQVYLEGLSRPEAPVRLSGVLARGSERSAACAAHYGVPLFTRPADLPGDISVACVVVRSGLLGGRGTELAAELMARGVHVLQEHPVHHDELAECLRAARRHRVQYQLNSFYPHLPPVRGFLRAAAELRARRPIRYVEAACAFQVGYALLDIVTTLLGRTRPWEFAADADGTGPFRAVSGRIGQVPVSLRIQHELDPADPDAGELLLHRVTLGTDAGELTLASSHGPVVWTARPRIPADVRDLSAAPIFQAAGTSTTGGTSGTGGTGDDPCWALPGTTGTVGPSSGAAYRMLWPEAAAGAVAALAADICAGSDPLRAGQRTMELCRMWQRLAELLGPPERVSNARWEPLGFDDRQALAAAAGNGAHVGREAAWPTTAG